MNSYKDHFKDYLEKTKSEIESDEALPQSCPVCETRIHRVTANGKSWLACECMPRPDCLGAEHRAALLRRWGKEVEEEMWEIPESFPPGTIPKPIDGIQ